MRCGDPGKRKARITKPTQRQTPGNDGNRRKAPRARPRARRRDGTARFFRSDNETSTEIEPFATLGS